ncbi:MAG: hypothetical protein JNL69_06140 [Bacteroidia bacterium]|nr:hypothetical protein [Bacteroidia bacterium]
MKNVLIIINIFIFIISCSNSKNKINSNEINANDSIYQSQENYISESEYELNYVVSVANGYNYDSLRQIAIQASDFLKFNFDTLSRYYNTEKKKIILHENDIDDMWAGEYYLRRSGENIVSIEMQTAYIDTLTIKDKIATERFYSDTLKMFVFATMYTNKKQADSLLKILKPKYKQASIIPTEIYMGCMH